MAKSGNTGKGNYPASKVSQSFKVLSEGIKSAPKPKFPNKHTTTTEYKKTLKKVEESE